MKQRTINRSKEVKEAHARLLEEHRARVKKLHVLADLAEDLRAAIPQISYFEQTSTCYKSVAIERRPAIKVKLLPEYNELTVVTYNMPYDQVVEHIAGPAHRLTGALWHMDVDQEGDIELYGYVKEDSHNPRINFEVTKGMPKCKIVRVKTKPSYWDNYQYRIKCS